MSNSIFEAVESMIADDESIEEVINAVAEAEEFFVNNGETHAIFNMIVKSIPLNDQGDYTVERLDCVLGDVGLIAEGLFAILSELAQSGDTALLELIEQVTSDVRDEITAETTGYDPKTVH